MQKLCQWVRDRKTQALRKLRRRRDSLEDARKGLPRHAESFAVLREAEPSCSDTGGVMSQSTPDFEEFFQEAAPGIEEAINRRESFAFRVSPRRSRKKSVLASPVLPPDCDDEGWAQLKVIGPTSSAVSSSTLSSIRPRSPRQIRFKIPEVQISFEEEEPQRVIFEAGEGSSRQDSPVEPEAGGSSPNTLMIESCPAMSSNGMRPALRNVRPISFDSPSNDDTASQISRELRRKSLAAAQRRPSTTQATVSLARPSLISATSVAGSQTQHLYFQPLLGFFQSLYSHLYPVFMVQLVASMSGRRTSTTLIPLTPAQIHLVRSLWRPIYQSRGPTTIGTSIYHRLIFKCPEVKEQIRNVRLPEEFANRDEFVKAHCKAMADLLDQVIESLDNLDSMSERLMRVGRVHARLGKGEFPGKLWNIVAETFIDCTLEWGDKRCRTENVRKAWALIVAFMIEKIKHGHHEQVRRRFRVR